MRRFVVVALLASAFLVIASAGTANASVRWPARCSNFKCVNAHLNALHAAQKKTAANLNTFLGCIGLAPTTQYTGYRATDGVSTLDALNYTLSGDPIDAWIIGIPGGTCGFAGVASVTPHVNGAAPAPFRRFYQP
jgi:hypothetical protein